MSDTPAAVELLTTVERRELRLLVVPTPYGTWQAIVHNQYGSHLATAAGHEDLTDCLAAINRILEGQETTHA